MGLPFLTCVFVQTCIHVRVIKTVYFDFHCWGTLVGLVFWWIVDGFGWNWFFQVVCSICNTEQQVWLLQSGWFTSLIFFWREVWNGFVGRLPRFVLIAVSKWGNIFAAFASSMMMMWDYLFLCLSFVDEVDINSWTCCIRSYIFRIQWNVYLLIV